MRRAATLLAPLLLAPLLLAACDGGEPLIERKPREPGPFPAADRPVAHIVSARWSNEEARDRLTPRPAPATRTSRISHAT